MTAAGTNGNGGNGGTVDFDDADDGGLNGDSGAKLSFKKILLVVLLIIGLIALVIFGAFTYFKQGFNIFHKPDAVSKKQRNWSAAPDDIGRFIAPPPATEKQPLLLPTVEPQPESPPPIIEQPPALQQPNIEQGEQPPSLKSRRLGGSEAAIRASGPYPVAAGQTDAQHRLHPDQGDQNPLHPGIQYRQRATRIYQLHHQSGCV